MNTQTEKSKDDYSRNFICLRFVLFPFYDSYHRLCCVINEQVSVKKNNEHANREK